MAFCIWITGLPGSGKTSIVKEFLEIYDGEIEVLSMDSIRKELTPNLKYTEEERDVAYTKLVDMAKELVENGKDVIIDATGHRKRWREYARKEISNFNEIYVKCSLEKAMEKEAARKDNVHLADMYKKALERKRTGKDMRNLGEIIGIDVPYEEPQNAEVVIDRDTTRTAEAAKLLKDYVEKI